MICVLVCRTERVKVGNQTSNLHSLEHQICISSQERGLPFPEDPINISMQSKEKNKLKLKPDYAWREENATKRVILVLYKNILTKVSNFCNIIFKTYFAIFYADFRICNLIKELRQLEVKQV